MEPIFFLVGCVTALAYLSHKATQASHRTAMDDFVKRSREADRSVRQRLCQGRYNDERSE